MTLAETSNAQWFAQDSWNIKRRLNLDLGARFAWFQHWRHPDGETASFALERYDAAQAPRLIQPALVNGARQGRNPLTGEIVSATLIGTLAPNSGNILNGMVAGTDDSYPKGFKEPAPILFEPRVGFAFDVLGNGKTALRGGFGTTHLILPSGFISRQATRNPAQANPSYF